MKNKAKEFLGNEMKVKMNTAWNLHECALQMVVP